MSRSESASRARTARAAIAYARDLKRFSPWSSRKSAICSRTWATVRGSIAQIYTGGPARSEGCRDAPPQPSRTSTYGSLDHPSSFEVGCASSARGERSRCAMARMRSARARSSSQACGSPGARRPESRWRRARPLPSRAFPQRRRAGGVEVGSVGDERDARSVRAEAQDQQRAEMRPGVRGGLRVIHDDEAAVNGLEWRIRRHARPEPEVRELEVARRRAGEDPAPQVGRGRCEPVEDRGVEHVRAPPERPELVAVVEELGVFLERVGRRVVGHHLLQRDARVPEEHELIAAARIRAARLGLLADHREERRLEWLEDHLVRRDARRHVDAATPRRRGEVVRPGGPRSPRPPGGRPRARGAGSRSHPSPVRRPRAPAPPCATRRPRR